MSGTGLVMRACMQLVDLLQPAEAGRMSPPVSLSRAPGTFVLANTCLRIESVNDADTALAFARTRSVNWGLGPSAEADFSALPNRAHAFVRVVLMDTHTGTVSALHIVDLAGASPVFFQP